MSRTRMTTAFLSFYDILFVIVASGDALISSPLGNPLKYIDGTW